MNTTNWHNLHAIRETAFNNLFLFWNCKAMNSDTQKWLIIFFINKEWKNFTIDLVFFI